MAATLKPAWRGGKGVLGRYAEGGEVNPDQDILDFEELNRKIDRQPRHIQQMTHRPTAPRRPVPIDLPLGLDVAPKADYRTAPGLEALTNAGVLAANLGAYATPLAPVMAGVDFADGIYEGDPISTLTSAIGVKNKALRKGILALGAAQAATTPSSSAEAAKRKLSDDEIEAIRFARTLPERRAGGGRVLKGALSQLDRFVKGKPETVKIPGFGEVRAAPVKELDEAADRYMRATGRPGEHRIEEFPEYDEEMARRIAQAYDEMKHAPSDPEVKRSYDAMIDETMAQYRALPEDLDIKFLKEPGKDPYAKSPSMGYADLIQNGRLHVFPTEAGFGTRDADVNNNPLLKRVGKVGDLKDATANDAFRVVHDIYGHFAPGNPFFRAPGEERAWNAHSRMFSRDALPAMTSETRGQNSWVNKGPFAGHNRAASGADTIYADQKAGILPSWAYEGRATGGFVQGYAGGGLKKAGAALGVLASTLGPALKGLPAKDPTAISMPMVRTAPSALFDYSKLSEVPNRPQFDLERKVPARGVSDRTQDLVIDRAVRRKVEGVVDKGIGMGGLDWYNTEPLREEFITELGSDAGEQAYRRFFDYVAASSPRSKVPENARNSTYYYMLDRQGQQLPEKNPQPYGHLAQNLHRDNFEELAKGPWNIFDHPKPASFVENLTGNQRPVTVDAHAIKLPGMLSKDPRFLAKDYRYQDEGNDEWLSYKPRKEHAAGNLSIRDALKNPSYWESAPRPNEYGALEKYYQEIAKRKGISPAQVQASAWVGGGDMTNLASGSDPFLKHFENRLNTTAAEMGIPPQDALRRFIRGEIAFKRFGGLV